MGLGELSPWHLLILAAIFLVLFGAKKLPDSARSLGRAMRIFKAETQGLRGEENGDDQPKAAAPPQQLPAATAPPAQARADEGAAVSGAGVPEAQHSNQPQPH